MAESPFQIHRRMSATDAGFLYLERANATLHIGCVAVVEGRLSAEELARRIERRLPRMWRYAQRPVPSPLGLDHPSWEDDPDFDVRAHVRHWAVPAPGGETELNQICARLFEQPLDRSRPLWEMHVLEGLDGGRTAVFQKVHHCMIDGVSGAQLLEELLSASPSEDEAAWLPPFPPCETGYGRRLSSAVGAGLRRIFHNTSGAAGWLVKPARARAAARRLGDAAWSALRLATRDVPELPWNAPLGRRRRLCFTRMPLEQIKRAGKARGATVNDVVLALLAGGLHTYLEGMGRSTEGLEVTALVPVSLRPPGEEAAPGNRISAMLVPLAVDIAEPVPRLVATQAITESLKTGAAWAGIDALLDLLDELPAGIVSGVARRLRVPRIANLVATNVPGPREHRWLCGRSVEAIYPIVPITDDIGLGLAVFSYDGWLHIGLISDAELLPDLEKLQHAMEHSYTSLATSL